MNFGHDKRVDYLRDMSYDTLVLILNENKERLKSINISSLLKFLSDINLSEILYILSLPNPLLA